MIIDRPQPGDVPMLRRLWQQAFGDTDDFLDSFFAVGFSPDRCRCLWLDGSLAAALYWFDCSWEGKPVAYLYAVATDEKYRGRGLCRALLEDTHRHLEEQGYAASVLVPGSKELFGLYEKLGYQNFGAVREFSCEAGNSPLPLQKLTAAEYARQRRKLLPAGAILQEGTLLAFLDTQAEFYAGETFLLAATVTQGMLTAQEFLGEAEAAPGILAALGISKGHFRTPGNEKSFAMFCPLQKHAKTPAYFGIALD